MTHDGENYAPHYNSHATPGYEFIEGCIQTYTHGDACRSTHSHGAEKPQPDNAVFIPELVSKAVFYRFFSLLSFFSLEPFYNRPYFIAQKGGNKNSG